MLGRVELAGFLAGVGGEALDEINVGVTDHVLGDPRRAQVELGEIAQQVFQPTVAVLGLAEVRLAVEVDVAEHAFKLGFVGLLDMVQHDVDQLAEVGRLAPLKQGIEVGQETIGDLAGLFILELDIGQDEALALQLAADTLFVVPVFLLVLGVVVGPLIADVLQEQHHQDVVLVLRRVDDAAEGVAGGPGGVVNFLLRNLVCHGADSRAYWVRM